MDKITFANGDEHTCPFCAENPNDNTIFVAVADVSFVDAAALFADATKTAEMTFAGNTYTGYTELRGLYVLPYGIQAALKRSNA